MIKWIGTERKSFYIRKNIFLARQNDAKHTNVYSFASIGVKDERKNGNGRTFSAEKARKVAAKHKNRQRPKIRVYPGKGNRLHLLAYLQTSGYFQNTGHSRVRKAGTHKVR